MSIWSELSLPWQCCLEEAWAAYSAGSLPVGAVVTDPTGNILTRGRNRILGPIEQGEITNHLLAHAELNALLKLDCPFNASFDRVLYTTMEPCPLCIGALCQSNIRQFCFASRDPFAGSSQLLQAIPYLKNLQVQAQGPSRSDLEYFIHVIEAEFLIRMGVREMGYQIYFDLVSNQISPRVVPFAEKLAKSGELNQLSKKGESIREVLDFLEEANKNPAYFA